MRAVRVRNQRVKWPVKQTQGRQTPACGSAPQAARMAGSDRKRQRRCKRCCANQQQATGNRGAQPWRRRNATGSGTAYA